MELCGKIVAVGKAASECDFRDRQLRMKTEQDLRFFQTFPEQLPAEGRMKMFPQQSSEVIRIHSEQVGQVGQRDIVLIMVVDERQTIPDIKIFIPPFDLIHAAAEGNGAEFHFQRLPQEQCASGQFRPPVFSCLPGRFPVKEIRRRPVREHQSADIQHGSHPVFEPDRRGIFEDAERAFPAEAMTVPGDRAAAFFIAAAGLVAVMLFGRTAERNVMQILVRRQFQFFTMEKNRMADFQTDRKVMFFFDEMHQIPEQHDLQILHYLR